LLKEEEEEEEETKRKKRVPPPFSRSSRERGDSDFPNTITPDVAM